jgi:hypothetical protein
MTDTVTIASVSGVNTDGSKQYGTQAEIKARVESVRQRTYGADGTSATAVDRISTHTEIKEDDLIWLPGADTSSRDEAHTPSDIAKSKSLVGGSTLWEVTL